MINVPCKLSKEIGSGYFAGPGKIAPRGYFAGPGKIRQNSLYAILPGPAK